MALRDVILSDSPTNYYEFTETSGTTLASATGTTNLNIVGPGTVVRTSTGPQLTKAIQANDQGYISSNVYPDFMNNSSFTLEFWFKVPVGGAATGAGFPTLFRRDGNGRAYLMRYRDASVSPGGAKAEAYTNGRTKYSVPSVNDNTWHHYVLVRSGSTFIEYLDGQTSNWASSSGSTSVGGTGVSIINFLAGTSSGDVYGAAANDSAAGLSISNIAIYNSTALSSTRVAAHWDESIRVQNASYSATPMVMSNANSPTAVIKAVKTVKFSASPMTASTVAPNASVTAQQFDFVRKDFVDDANLRSNGSVTDIGRSTANILRDSFGNNDSYSFKVNMSNYANRTFESAHMVLATPGFSTQPIVWDIYEISTNWSDAAGDIISVPTPESPVTSVTVPAFGQYSEIKIPLDISFVKANSGTKAFRIVSRNLDSAEIYTLNGTSAGIDTIPRFEFRMVPQEPQSVVVTAPVATMTASAPDAVFSANKTATVNANASSATLSSPTAIITTEKNANANVNSFNVSLLAVEPAVEIVSPDVSYAANAFVATVSVIEPTVIPGQAIVVSADANDGATLSMTDAEFSNKNPINVSTSALLMNSKIVTPTVNGLDIGQFDDPFQTLIRGRLDGDDMWLRFREAAGADRVYSINPTTPVGSIYNYEFIATGDRVINSGPGFHRSMAFNGTTDFLQQVIPQDDLLLQGSVIFHIRVTGKNQVIYRSAGDSRTGSFSGRTYVTDVSLVDGKINVDTDYGSLPDNPNKITLTGFKDVADGEWHQIAITNAFQGSESTIDSGVSGAGTTIFVDGKLDRRIRQYIPVGKPDTIGKIDTRYFRGELSEVVHFSFLGVTKYFIEQAYYAFFDMNPIRVTPFGVTAAMGNNKGKGNAKRILVLHWRWKPQQAANLSQALPDSPGLDTLWSDNGDNALVGSNAVAKYGGVYPPFVGTDEDILKSIPMFPGAQMSFQSVFARGNTPSDGAFFRDEITDEQRLIDLQKDIDMTDFDAIYFADWPGVSFVNRYGAMYRPGAAYDALLESIKKAVFDDGKEMLIASPDLAKALGLVDEFDSKNLVWESKYATSGYSTMSGQGAGQVPGDFYSAYNSPFTNIEAYKGNDNQARRAIAENTGSFGKESNGRRTYFDTHRGQLHRVAASVPGLTDIGGAALAEMTYFRRDTSDYKETAAVSYRYLERPDGLRLGDEIYIEGPIAGYAKEADSAEIAGPKSYNLISFRPEEINVGVAVFKESAQVWEGTQLTPNPTRENATLIAIDKGSVLDGRVINGKIVIMPNDYATFTESSTVVFFQDLTIPNGFTNGDDYRNRPIVMPENEQTKKWQFSTWRFTNSRMDQISETLKVVSGRNGAAAIASNLTTFTSSVASPIDQYPVAYAPVAMRAWNWLVTVEEELDEGDVRVRPEPMVVDVISPAASTEAGKQVTVKNQATNITMNMVRPVEDNLGGTDVLVPVMRASFVAPNTVTKFFVEQMTVELSLPDPDEADRLDLSDVVYLTFFGQQEITLNRKDT